MAGAPTAAGFAYFAGVKAIGYTAAAAVLKHGYQAIAPVKTNVVTVGLSRTGIGLADGLTYGGLWILAANLIRNPSDSLPLYYYTFLLPVRLAEWTFLIWSFFDRSLHDRVRMWKCVAFGTICSYILDVDRRRRGLRVAWRTLGLLTAEPCPRRDRVILEAIARRAKVPEGLPTIARHFNAG